MQNNKIALVGMGIAGSILSHHLIKNDFDVTIFNKSENNSSSRVAAGMFNAIIPRRVTKTWIADDLFNYLHEYYPNLETEIGCTFFHEKSIIHPFEWQKEQNDWLSKISHPAFQNYFKEGLQVNNNSYINAPLGLSCIKRGGYCDTISMLDGFKTYYQKLGNYIETKVNLEDISINGASVEVNGVGFDKLIFCEGTKAISNLFFPDLPFKFAKGELLKVHIPDLKLNEILLGGVFLIPIGNDEYFLGSTYEWDFSHNNPTNKAKENLLNRVKSYLPNLDINVLEQRAGVRPAIKDRRPIIGFHKNEKVGIFNGFGSKAISLVPFWANEFTQSIKNGNTMTQEVNCLRFY